MRATPTQLNLLRTRPQSSRLYLSIFQPTTIFQAQVNSPSIAKGARTIPYNNVTAGSWTAIESNFSAYIGSTPGASDLGRIRVRSATSSELTVAENSNIPWADDLYITVVRFVQLDPINPRIINNPSNVEDVIFYKDWDIPYTNQNRVLGTFVNMGSDRAAFRGEQLNYTSTGTYNMLGSSLSYFWHFEGGTPSGSTSAHPGLVSYNSTGHFLTRLIVSGSAGESDVSYRTVSIYDRPWEGSSTPVLLWEMGSLNGSRDEAGYKATFTIHENIDVKENAVVVLFSDDWYGSTNQSIGGNYSGGEKIFFVGRILADSINYDYQHSTVSFDASSLTEVMKNALAFSVSVESVASPLVWYQLYDMDCRRAIYHYLRWHSTALNIADFQFLGQDQKIQFFDADRTSMFDAIDNLMRNTLIGQVVSDRQGKVWMEVEAKAYPNPTGSFTSVMDITKQDWMNDPTIDEKLSNDTSYLELGGIAYTGVASNTFSALIASAPGNSPSFRGKVDTREGLALTDQAQLNAMVGNIWANDNAQFPKMQMDMTENLRNLDIAPQETVFISVKPSDTVRNKLIEGLYIPSGFDWRYDSKNQILLPNIDFTNLVNGNTGDSVEIPISPADAGFDSGFSVPGLQLPPLPLFMPPGNASSGLITNAINSYQGYYAGRNVDFSASVDQYTRGFLIASSAAPSAGTIQFQPGADFLSGIYLCVVHFSQFDSVTFNVEIELQVPGIASSQSRLSGALNDTANYFASGALSLIVNNSSSVIAFSWTSSSPEILHNYAYSFNVVRISS